MRHSMSKPAEDMNKQMQHSSWLFEAALSCNQSPLPGHPQAHAQMHQHSTADLSRHRRIALLSQVFTAASWQSSPVA